MGRALFVPVDVDHDELSWKKEWYEPIYI